MSRRQQFHKLQQVVVQRTMWLPPAVAAPAVVAAPARPISVEEAQREAVKLLTQLHDEKERANADHAKQTARLSAELKTAQDSRLDSASDARRKLASATAEARALLDNAHAAETARIADEDAAAVKELAKGLGINEAKTSSIPSAWHFDQRQRTTQALLEHHKQYRATLERRKQGELAALRTDARLVEEECGNTLGMVEETYRATIAEHEKRLNELRAAFEREQAAIRLVREKEAVASQERIAKHEHTWQQRLQCSHESIQQTQAAVTALQQEEAEWKARVVAGRLHTLSRDDVDQLLVMWGFDVPRDVLDKTKADGIALDDLPEAEMEEALQLRRFGDRRRLTILLTRLKHGLGIDPVHHEPGTLCWSVEEVAQWLRDSELEDVVDHFREHNITGDVLLKLTRQDMPSLGIANLGDRARVAKAISQLRKQVQTGQHTDGVAQATSVGAATVAALTQREVLELVLQENEELKETLEQVRQQFQTARQVPHEYKCPITMEVMLDPVIAADGHSYEREAIEAWLQIRQTSPLTNQTMSNLIIPNLTVKKLIAAFFEQQEGSEGRE